MAAYGQYLLIDFSCLFCIMEAQIYTPRLFHHYESICAGVQMAVNLVWR